MIYAINIFIIGVSQTNLLGHLSGFSLGWMGMIHKPTSRTEDTGHSSRKSLEVQFEIEWDESDTSVTPVENEFNNGKRRERRNVMKNWLKNIESKFDSSGTKDSVSFDFDNY